MGINQRREFLDCGLVRHSRYLSNTSDASENVYKEGLGAHNRQSNLLRVQVCSSYQFIKSSAKSYQVSCVISVTFSKKGNSNSKSDYINKFVVKSQIL